MNANDRQVGGGHYAASYQHWDLVADLGLGYFEGQITKYVARWRKKNGLQDLEKAMHFLEKLVELVVYQGWTARSSAHYGFTGTTRSGKHTTADALCSWFCHTNGLSEDEKYVIYHVATWGPNWAALEKARAKLAGMLYTARMEQAIELGSGPVKMDPGIPEGDTCITIRVEVKDGGIVYDSGEPGPGYVDQDRKE